MALEWLTVQIPFNWSVENFFEVAGSIALWVSLSKVPFSPMTKSMKLSLFQTRYELGPTASSSAPTWWSTARRMPPTTSPGATIPSARSRLVANTAEFLPVVRLNMATNQTQFYRRPVIVKISYWVMNLKPIVGWLGPNLTLYASVITNKFELKYVFETKFF